MCSIERSAPTDLPIEFEEIVLKVHRRTLIDRSSLGIGSGEKVVVRGPSGCGKSSLLKCAVGAFPIAEGSIRVEGRDLSSTTVADIRARIAFIGQEPTLSAATVREALLLPFTFKAHRKHPPSNRRIAESMERLHLAKSMLGQPCNRISGGEKQRIAICRALLLDKTIFLVDEATSALDPESRKAVMEELFRPDTTLLSISHDPEWIDACDRIATISNHRIVEDVE